jgi:C-terminal processing protease CtpA/Prc
MNKYIALLLVILFSLILSCNQALDKNHINNFHVEKHVAMCQVWGLLKYYHPGASSGKINWDDQLFNILNRLDSINNKKHLNILISEVFNTCDSIDNETIDTSYMKGEVKYKRKVKWLEDTTYISQKNLIYLKELIDQKGPYINYYVKQNVNSGNLNYSNEISYSDSTRPSLNLRLLSLFRHWNIIYYFYPYVEINDTPWGDILIKYIPKFIEANDSLEYQLTVLEYTSEINDGHVWTESYTIAMHLGIFSPPYKVKCVENKAIICEFFPDSIGNLYNVELGDEILAIDNLPIDTIIKNRSKYYSYSNKNQFNRRIYEELLITPNPDSIVLDIRRNKAIFQEVVPTYYLYELYQHLDKQESKTSAFKKIEDSIGYINLRYLDVSDIAQIMTQSKSFNKIIIDIRNYPHGVMYELAKYFNPEPEEFVKVFVPNLEKPGEFIWHQEKFFVGINNPNYFNGKLVLLVNEYTQSHAEFTAMCLQTAPNVITIGSMTAGTDGNMSKVELPGGIDTYFTGIGIEYPDGTTTQRIGVKVDVVILPQIEDFQCNYDRVLEAAIDL